VPFILLAESPGSDIFAFSICLILTAVPWPSFVEQAAFQWLTQASTMLTVAALNVLQIAAVQHGNLVELRTGLVGIDEACSGMQSLQAACMMSLFLGELYRASLLRRSVLVMGGIGIAFLCNVGRTLLLTAVAAQSGLAAMGDWHNPLGYAILTACFLSIWGVARVISGPLPMLAAAARTALTRFPRGLIFGLGGWTLFTVIATEIWYRGHERTPTLHWSVAWPVYKQEFADIPITKPEADSLLFDQGRGAEWADGDGSHWVVYFFRWAQGPSWSRILARGHLPEVCFPAAGYKSSGDHGVITVEAKGLSIPFHALDFEDGGNIEYVFFCLWEEGLKSSERPRGQDKCSQFTRLRSVLLGERNLAQQTLEVVISGYDRPEEAETAFRHEIVTLIDTRTSDPVGDTSSR
jgi:exosortase/archaeosortase family protein